MGGGGVFPSLCACARHYAGLSILLLMHRPPPHPGGEGGRGSYLGSVYRTHTSLPPPSAVHSHVKFFYQCTNTGGTKLIALTRLFLKGLSHEIKKGGGVLFNVLYMQLWASFVQNLTSFMV